MDLALALLEYDHGRELTLDVARELVLFLKRPGGQSQFSTLLVAQPRPAAEGWPGLSEEKLNQGRYLMHTIDYRSLMGELLVEHLGRNRSELEHLLPGI